MSKKILITIAVLFVLTFLFVNRQKKNSIKNKAATVEQVNERTVKSQPTKTDSIQEDALKKMSERTDVTVAPTMSAGYFRDDSGRRFVTVKMLPLKQCNEGDADGMLELKRQHGARLIASLEPLDDKGAGKAMAKEITEADLFRGTEMVFEVKEDTPKAFALFVCSDLRGKDRCLGKAAADLVFGYPTFRMSIEGKKEKNLIFFVHLMILDKQNFQVYHSDFALENVVKTLASAFNKPKLSNEEFGRAEYLTSLLQAIRPFPIELVNDGGPGTLLQMSFTKQDNSACNN
jgi:hypothetical protein